MEKFILLLNVFAVILPLNFVQAASSQPQPSPAPSSSPSPAGPVKAAAQAVLPEALQAAISKEAPGYELVTPQDFREDFVATIKKWKIPYQFDALITHDFNGDKLPDYVVQLVNKGDKSFVFYAFVTRKKTFKAIRLSKTQWLGEMDKPVCRAMRLKPPREPGISGREYFQADLPQAKKDQAKDDYLKIAAIETDLPLYEKGKDPVCAAKNEENFYCSEGYFFNKAGELRKVTVCD